MTPIFLITIKKKIAFSVSILRSVKQGYSFYTFLIWGYASTKSLRIADVTDPDLPNPEGFIVCT
jgi:hypothetical protein